MSCYFGVCIVRVCCVGVDGDEIHRTCAFFRSYLWCRLAHALVAVLWVVVVWLE